MASVQFSTPLEQYETGTPCGVKSTQISLSISFLQVDVRKESVPSSIRRAVSFRSRLNDFKSAEVYHVAKRSAAVISDTCIVSRTCSRHLAPLLLSLNKLSPSIAGGKETLRELRGRLLFK